MENNPIIGPDVGQLAGRLKPKTRLHRPHPLLNTSARPAARRREHEGFAMSQHSSLRSSGSMAAKRNVLKRFERVALLKSRNQWKEGDRITGLRKTKPPE